MSLASVWQQPSSEAVGQAPATVLPTCLQDESSAPLNALSTFPYTVQVREPPVPFTHTVD